MKHDQVFEWLVRYHVEKNLPLFKSELKEGQASSIEPDDIGYDYATPKKAKRCLIFSNGDDLIDKLKENEVINDDEDPEFHETPTYETFARYLDTARGDGAYAHHKKCMSMGRVHDINNKVALHGLNNLIDRLPPELVSYDGSVPLREIGCKTRLAIKMPHAYSHVETYQIKATVHSPIGTGVVTHFTQDSLELFYFAYEPNVNKEYIDEENSITGIYKRFKLIQNKFKLVEEYNASIDDKGKLKYHEIREEYVQKKVVNA